MKIPENGVKRRILTPDDDSGAQYFFGYYDLLSYDADDRRHLFHRVNVDFCGGLPTEHDAAELGYIDLETGEVTCFAETTAWNYQQGAMLQWNPGNPNEEVIFNIRDGKEYRAVTLNLKTGKRKVADRPVANVSPDGKWGLSINLSRVYDFRPGYGYCGVRDPWYDVNTPADDGVYLIDMETGKSKLIIDYQHIWNEFGNKEFEGCKFVVNHITFNTASNRFLFLNRNFKRPGDGIWATSLFTSDLDGNLYELLDCTCVSHYNWKDEKTICGYLEYNGKRGIYELEDQTKNGVELHSPYFGRDIHTIYSPDRRYLIGDSYPDSKSERTIYIYDMKTGESAPLYAEFSKAPVIGDNRCDLHNIWNHRGDRISYDSTHRGKREICELDVSFLKDSES